MPGHELQDRASLAMARRVADELSRRPQEVLAIAHENLARWSSRNADAPSLLRCYHEWRTILDLPIPRICAILTAQTDDGQRLRQNSPFPGVLSPSEVWHIKDKARNDPSAT